MAKTGYQDVPDELRDDFNRSIQQRDRYILGVSQSQRRLTPKEKLKELGRGSVFKFLSPLWRALTTEQKNVWKEAAAFSSLNGWQLFISDNAARIKNDLELGIPPSNLWQVRIGKITIDSPADGIRLKQTHDKHRYDIRKKPGQPWKYIIVEVEETFSMPMTLELRYKSDLTQTGDSPIARYFAEVWMTYQGENQFVQGQIDILPNEDWTIDSITLPVVPGILVSYTLWIEILDYEGTVMIDNIRANHSGTNWARDPRFNEMDKVFTKAFSIVQPYWEPVYKPDGASYTSVFEPIANI